MFVFNKQRAIATSLTLALVLASAGCATTQLKEQWRDPAYRAADAPRILVIAVIGRQENRRDFEDQFVAHLRQEGVDATPSYPQLSVSGPENLDAVKTVVERSGATMVLSVRLVNMNEQTAVSGGYQGSAGFYGYYPHSHAGVYTYSPPTTYTYRTYMTETRVFDLKSDKMIWAATMQSKEPSNFKAAASEYAGLIVQQMQYNKIIAKR